MGGSGGSGSGSRMRPEVIQQWLRREQDKSTNAEMDQKVSAFVDELLADFNSRDVESTAAHLETIRGALKDGVGRAVDMKFGGSIDKHTYVDGLSDVDALVLLDGVNMAKQSPDRVLAQFARALRARLPRTQIKAGTLAVTVTFADGHCIQLLPATRSGRGFRIPSDDGLSWSRINPRRFARELTTVNQRCGGKVVPTIKLAKAVLNSVSNRLPEDARPTGYHIEALAVRAFRDYKGAPTTRAMLKHFFAEAAVLARQPIRDSTGQSVHVDDRLGKADSPSRVALSRALDRVARRIRNADAGPSLAQWRSLFGEVG